jgi:excisionase family DNA binding protein
MAGTRKQEGAGATMPEGLLTRDEVAAVLNISKTFTYTLITDGRIPSIKIGRSRRVRPQDLEHYLDSLSEAQNPQR